MGKPSGQSVDPVKIFEQAHGFYQALAILSNVEPENLQLAVTIGEPVMVIGSFTIELQLKCLICIETGALPARVHNLRDLFEKLSPETQAKAQAEWEKIARFRASEWDGYEKSLGITIARDLPGALSVGGDAFQRIRYSYEGGNETLQYYLYDLPRALGRVILQLRPEWNGHQRSFQPLPGSSHP